MSDYIFFAEEDRGTIWPKLLKDFIGKVKQDGEYEDLVNLSKIDCSDSIKAEIELDLNRTELMGVGSDMNEGVSKLRECLVTYACRNPSVGYCQGMNFIAAGLLRFLDSESAFWVLCIIIEILLKGHHDKIMFGGKTDARILEELLVEFDPEMIVKMENLDFEISLVSTQWFIPLFLHALPERVVFSLWDILFQKLASGDEEEGIEAASSILLSTAVQIFTHERETIMTCTDSGEVHSKILSFGESLDSEEKQESFISTVLAFSAKIEKGTINSLRERHQLQLQAELSIDNGGKMWNKITYVDFPPGPLSFSFVEKNGKITVTKLEMDKDSGSPGDAMRSGKIAEGSVIVSINLHIVVGEKIESVVEEIRKLREITSYRIGFYNDDATLDKIKAENELKASKPSYEDDGYSPVLLDGEQFFCVIPCKLKDYSLSSNGETVSHLRVCKLFMTNYRIIIHRFPLQRNNETILNHWIPPSILSPSSKPSIGSTRRSFLRYRSVSNGSGSGSGTPDHIEMEARNSIPELMLICENKDNDVQFPILFISSINASTGISIDILLKDFRQLELLFADDSLCHKLNEMMKAVVFIEIITHTFAFSKGVDKLFPNTPLLNGWKLYEPVLDYERIGFFMSSKWRLFKQANYSTILTYPDLLILPRSSSDEEIESVSKFRSRGRIPCAVWIHPTSKAVLARGAQPNVGLTNQKSENDVKMLSNMMLNNGKKKDVYDIVDARSSIATMGNKTRGKGTENVSLYPGSNIVHMNVANIHAVRSSAEMLATVLQLKVDDENFHKKVVDTQWLSHIKSIMSAVIRVVNRLEVEGVSVFVHCSDGWDRTAQIVALTELLLDPFYRTIKGFAILIEKEWNSFGHQFSRRCGHLAEANKDEQSPIFLQFLDCVYQCQKQFPTAFEFNEDFLITIQDHALAGRYGTFLTNSEKERIDLNVEGQTSSIWNFLLHPNYIHNFINYNFKHYEGSITPSAQTKHLRLWEGYFFRWDSSYVHRKKVVTFY